MKSDCKLLMHTGHVFEEDRTPHGLSFQLNQINSLYRHIHTAGHHVTLVGKQSCLHAVLLLLEECQWQICCSLGHMVFTLCLKIKGVSTWSFIVVYHVAKILVPQREFPCMIFQMMKEEERYVLKTLPESTDC